MARVYTDDEILSVFRIATHEAFDGGGNLFFGDVVVPISEIVAAPTNGVPDVAYIRGVLEKRGVAVPVDEKARGLYAKYLVRRADGTDDHGGKHENCRLFVLDLDHDPHALPAILAYASSAEYDGYEALSEDLYDIAKEIDGGSDTAWIEYAENGDFSLSDGAIGYLSDPGNRKRHREFVTALHNEVRPSECGELPSKAHRLCCIAIDAMNTLDAWDESRSLKAIAQQAWQTAEDKGFHAEFDRPSAYAFTKLALAHTEISEAAQEVKRHWVGMPTEEQLVPFGEELADAVIRIMDLAVSFGVDIEKHIAAKMDKNRRRAYMYGTPMEGMPSCLRSEEPR